MLPITVFPRFQQSYVGTVDDQLVGHSIIAEDVMVIFGDGKKVAIVTQFINTPFLA